MTTKVKSPNFTELEKETLLELVNSKKSIIESKTNDGKMVGRKNKEWENIGKEFNSRHGVHIRTLTQLKSLWKNLKARAKSAVAKDRREKKKTGGGPEEKKLDKFSFSISEMLPQQIHSLNNPFDDDASLHGDEAEQESDDENNNTREVRIFSFFEKGGCIVF